MENKVGVDRCPTGIDGMDELIDGGFPRGRTILLSGECGTGKTIFGLQFLCNGIKKYNEPGIYVSLEQNLKYLKEDSLAFNCDIDELEELGKLIIIDASLYRFNVGKLITNDVKHDKSFSLTSRDIVSSKEVVDIIIDTAKEIMAKRVVIDSLPALNSLIKTKEEVRDVVLNMNYKLQSVGLTSILVSDLIDKSTGYGVESYVSDGVVHLNYVTSGPDAGRNLFIKKMRGTKHSENINPFRFVEGSGIEVLGLGD